MGQIVEFTPKKELTKEDIWNHFVEMSNRVKEKEDGEDIQRQGDR